MRRTALRVSPLSLLAAGCSQGGDDVTVEVDPGGEAVPTATVTRTATNTSARGGDVPPLRR